MATSGFPPLTRSDVLACRFSSWYPTFRRHSPKASIIKPLEDRFIDYLEMDRVFIPEGSGPMGVSELSDDEGEGTGSDCSEDLTWQTKFTELDAQIRRVITKYDGAVFPKLNWSSPQDAAWMIPGSTLKCQSPADVYLLLKSSDFISHDLDHAFDACTDAERVEPEESLEAATNSLSLDGYPSTSDFATSEDDSPVAPPRRRPAPRRYDFELVLKKWFEMPKSQEWRCFVRDRQLVGISQRDSNYYEFLQPPEVQDEIKTKVLAFFEDEVRNVFPSPNYTFDIYFTRTNDRIFIIDFNPYGPQTDSLLLSWDTINSLGTSPESSSSSPSVLPIFEIVTNSVMSQALPSFSHNRYPKDVVDLSSGASIAEFADKWRGALKEGVAESDSDSAGSTRSKRSIGR